MRKKKEDLSKEVYVAKADNVELSMQLDKANESVETLKAKLATSLAAAPAVEPAKKEASEVSPASAKSDPDLKTELNASLSDNKGMKKEPEAKLATGGDPELKKKVFELKNKIDTLQAKIDVI